MRCCISMKNNTLRSVARYVTISPGGFDRGCGAPRAYASDSIRDSKDSASAPTMYLFMHMI
ncbi:protein of unknown function [Candidatus Nitrosocaldus cavascurensis]|uniref:Uncharacterized protein n=1 Tax=Candidatus Nitrosocaldus cavascurensis TaxID=2058097 RepID=A0A2K5AT90_9ARCH|nr:protein of unknown function [Candidatus Nitrosocaldus cavascurensis]